MQNSKSPKCARLFLRFHELTDERRNFISLRIQREVAGVEHVNFGIRDILAVAFRLSEIEREIMLAPEDQKLRLRLLHPRLPFRISVYVRAVVVEEIALNLSLIR